MLSDPDRQIKFVTVGIARFPRGSVRNTIYLWYHLLISAGRSTLNENFGYSLQIAYFSERVKERLGVTYRQFGGKTTVIAVCG